jgi:hypothetical protein
MLNSTEKSIILTNSDLIHLLKLNLYNVNSRHSIYQNILDHSIQASIKHDLFLIFPLIISIIL